jgi:hypothetical protein
MYDPSFDNRPVHMSRMRDWRVGKPIASTHGSRFAAL